MMARAPPRKKPLTATIPCTKIGMASRGVADCENRVPSEITPTSGGWERRAGSSADGVITYRLGAWSRFYEFLEAEVFHPSRASNQDYIWRGQRSSYWSLSSSLDRLFQKLSLLTAS